MTTKITLLSAATVNGASASVTPDVTATTESEFAAYGTFGGGTVALEQTVDGGTTWFSLAALTAPGRSTVKLFHGGAVRANLTGATAPSVTAVTFGLRGTGAITTS